MNLNLNNKKEQIHFSNSCYSRSTFLDERLPGNVVFKGVPMLAEGFDLWPMEDDPKHARSDG